MSSLEVDTRAPSTSGKGFFSRLYSILPFTASSSQQAFAEQYNAAVLDTSEDFSDLDMMGFLITGCKDKQGRPAVLVVAKRYQAAVLQPERVLRYFIRRTHTIAESEYVLVWVHTQASYRENCPSIQWLWQTYEKLPQQYRAHLHRTYVVHCDIMLWLSLMTLGPWMTSGFYSKVEWVSRVEFLWDHISKEGVEVPDFVAEHDQVLEEHPLMDYGILAPKDAPMVPGLPFPPMPAT